MTISRKTVQVSRSGPDLDVNDESTYFLVEDGLDPGNVGYRRQMVSGTFTEGQYQVGAVKDIASGTLVIAVKATTQAALRTAVDTLIDAMTQFTFTLQVTIDSLDWAWTCYSAEYGVLWKGPWIDATGEPVAVCAFTFPRQPTPTSGPA